MTEQTPTPTPTGIKDYSIGEIREDKLIMERAISNLLAEFEVSYGQDLITSISVERWNGSNSCWGKITRVSVGVNLL